MSALTFLSLLLASALLGTTYPEFSSASTLPPAVVAAPARDVPFYSQFRDIQSASWQKVGCGIASLAMVVEYHKPGSVDSVDTLLEEGIERGAYLPDVGWTYKGLIEVAGSYGLTGESYDLAGLGSEAAFAAFTQSLAEGPMIASVHYTFDPRNTIPHLVVIRAVEGDTVYYNDPAEPSGGGSLSVETFLKAWKKRYIAIHPVPSLAAVP